MSEPFTFDEDPDAPGWRRWAMVDRTRFNAWMEPIRVRVEREVARVRMEPRPEHANLRDAMHGGALLGFMDVAMFAGARGLGIVGAGGAVTVDLSAQFVGSASLDEPLEARVELLRETGRLLFLRGLLSQDRAGVVASFSGTLRKMDRR